MHRLLIPLLLFAWCAQAQDAPEKETPAPTEEEIQQAVSDLSSTEFQKREKAARLLWEGGRAAKPFLEAAVAKSDDLEAKLRAEQILKKFRYGIYPDTPPELAEILMLFRDGNQQQRRSIFAQLMQKQDVDTVLDLLETLPAEERNSYATTLFRNSADQLVAPLIIRGDMKRAETILGIMSHQNNGARDLAAFHFFTGNIEKAIAAEKGKSDDPSRFSRLAALLRAKGDLEAAKNAAKDIPDVGTRTAVADAIAISQGDIATYLKTLGLPSARGGAINLENAETLSLFLTKARLEGNQEQIATTSEKLRSLVDVDPDQIWYVTEAYLINDDPEAALELLKSKPQWTDRAAEILFEQRRPAELLAVLGIGGAASLEDLKPWIAEKLALLSRSNPGAPAGGGAPADEIPLEIRRERLEAEAALVHIARLHVRIGYLDAADRLFTQIGEAVIASKTAPHELAFVVAEAAESRRVEAAIAIVRKALEDWPDAGESIVPRLPLEDAGPWWGSVRNLAEFDPDLLASFDRFLKVYPDTATNPEVEFENDEQGDAKKIDPAALEEAKSLIGPSSRTPLKMAAQIFPA